MKGGIPPGLWAASLVQQAEIVAAMGSWVNQKSRDLRVWRDGQSSRV